MCTLKVDVGSLYSLRQGLSNERRVHPCGPVSPEQ